MKNIGKGAAWFVAYYVISIITTLTAAICWALVDSQSCSLAEAILNFQEYVMVAAIPGLLAAAIIFIAGFCIFKSIKKDSFDIGKVQISKAIFCITVGMLANVVISFIVSAVSAFLPTEAIEDLTSVTDAVTDVTYPVWLLILCTGIMVPITEEIVFRYGVHGTIARSSVLFAYVFSAIVFGIAHGNLIQGVYATVLGLMFSFVFDKGQNLWYPILMHMSINTTSVLISSISDETTVGLLFLGFGFIGLIGSIILLCVSKNVRAFFTKQPKEYTLDLTSQNE